MDLLQLRYFQAIANMGSITKAANYFLVPQPAMSQTLSRLEKSLGDIKLFDRLNNKLVLNENGRIFLEYVNNALRLLDDGVASISSNQMKINGNIHLLVLENRRFVTSCVQEFAQEYPDVNFYMSHDIYSDQLCSYDLYVTSAPLNDSSKTYIPLIKEPIVLNIPNSHPLATRESVSLSELKDEKFITMSQRSSLYDITLSCCKKCGFDPRMVFIFDDPYYVRKYVSANMGISLAPAVSWAGRFRENTVLIPIIDPEIYSMSYLSWDEQRWISPTVITFRSFLLQKAAQLPGNLIENNNI